MGRELWSAWGCDIRTIADAERVVAQALAHDGPVVVDVRTAVEHITAFQTIAQL